MEGDAKLQCVFPSLFQVVVPTIDLDMRHDSLEKENPNEISKVKGRREHFKQNNKANTQYQNYFCPVEVSGKLPNQNL